MRKLIVLSLAALAVASSVSARPAPPMGMSTVTTVLHNPAGNDPDKTVTNVTTYNRTGSTVTYKNARTISDPDDRAHGGQPHTKTTTGGCQVTGSHIPSSC